MRRSPAALLLLATAACAVQPPSTAVPLTTPVASTELAPLEAAIRARLAAVPTGEVAVAVVDTEGGRYVGINDRVVMHAASTMKVGVLIELYRQAAVRGQSLETPLHVRSDFRSAADASTYHLTADDDSDHELYDHLGGTLPMNELARRMIARSSNLATNLLIEVAVPDSINATLTAVDAAGMRVVRGVQDITAFERGLNNTTTAEGFARALAALVHCSVLPEPNCTAARGLLEAQEFRDMIPAGLPPGVRSANKGGWITGIRHDGAIIETGRGLPYVLVVMTRGLPDTAAAQQVARDVSALAWRALGRDGTLHRTAPPAELDDVLVLHSRHRVAGLGTNTLKYEQLWSQLLPIVEAAPAIDHEHVGTSLEGRALRLLRTGSGPTRVLLWSQMHGDETTATRALADLFAYIAAAPDDERVRRWRERLTILAVPMLNPDGAEHHARRNAVGIDVNRDARMLATPEGRALKAVRDRFSPEYGFNLHDQNPRWRVGTQERRAAVSLLAPPPDAARSETDGVRRAKRLATIMGQFIEPLVGGHVTRYDESFNPRAFGDLTQAWGTSAVLVESGGWPGEHTKHMLRRANFAMLVRAFDAIAADEPERGSSAWYASLPPNGRAMNDLLLTGAYIVLPGRAPVRADIAFDEGAPGADLRIVEIGDLGGVTARDTIDARGLFAHFPGDAAPLAPGPAPAFVLRTGSDTTGRTVWRYDGRLTRESAESIMPVEGTGTG